MERVKKDPLRRPFLKDQTSKIFMFLKSIFFKSSMIESWVEEVENDS